MNENPENKPYAEAVRGRRIAAAMLLFVALVTLLGSHLPFSWRDGMLVILGLGFIVWSALARSPGLLVPGCVLVGIGTGILLRAEYGSGAFLLSMAGGFLLLAGLSRVMFADRKCSLWPLWPAAGLTFAGVVQYAGSDIRQWLRTIGPFWPYVLIVVALFLWFSKPSPKK